MNKTIVTTSITTVLLSSICFFSPVYAAEANQNDTTSTTTSGTFDNNNQGDQNQQAAGAQQNAANMIDAKHEILVQLIDKALIEGDLSPEECNNLKAYIDQTHVGGVQSNANCQDTTPVAQGANAAQNLTGTASGADNNTNGSNVHVSTLSAPWAD